MHACMCVVGKGEVKLGALRVEDVSRAPVAGAHVLGTDRRSTLYI